MKPKTLEEINVPNNARSHVGALERADTHAHTHPCRYIAHMRTHIHIHVCAHIHSRTPVNTHTHTHTHTHPQINKRKEKTMETHGHYFTALLNQQHNRSLAV